MCKVFENLYLVVKGVHIFVKPLGTWKITTRWTWTPQSIPVSWLKLLALQAGLSGVNGKQLFSIYPHTDDCTLSTNYSFAAISFLAQNLTTTINNSKIWMTHWNPIHFCFYRSIEQYAPTNSSINWWIWMWSKTNLCFLFVRKVFSTYFVTVKTVEWSMFFN